MYTTEHTVRWLIRYKYHTIITLVRGRARELRLLLKNGEGKSSARSSGRSTVDTVDRWSTVPSSRLNYGDL